MVITDYKPPKQEFRPKDDHEKMLGEAVIRTKSYLSEKERIKETQQYFKHILDTDATSYTGKIHDFRPRNSEAEI